MAYPEEEIKEAEINYSAVWRISNEVFTKKASDVLNVPIERVQVHRSIANDSSFGKLSVHVFKENDEWRQHYDFHNGSTAYYNLSSNIYQFEEELKIGKNKKVWEG